MPPRLLLLVGLLALIGTGCRNNDGAVKLTVSYSGFKPGCIRVGVKDARGPGEPRTTELAGKGEATGGTVTVAAFRESGWGTTLAVTAEAFETQCSGTPVSTASETVTVRQGDVAEKELRLTATDSDRDGYVSLATGGTDCDDANARRYTGAPELCNAQDDNCDGTPDDGLALGTGCTGAGNCAGTRVCGTDGGVACNSPTPTVLYADSDLDTYGAADAGVTNCGPTRSGYVSNSTDCDDTRANVYPGAREICDSQDNDCDNSRDEGFTLGTSCNPGQNCPGQTACAADGGTRCAYVTEPVNHYPDEDLDQHGKADAGVLTCAPAAGYIPMGGDCDEGNPFTYAGAPELCDLVDNTCEGAVDEGNVCPAGGGTWVSQSTGTETWRSVTLWGDGGVWVAGSNSTLRSRPPGETAFRNFDGHCTGDWYGVWVEPSTQYAVLAGQGTAVAFHGPTGTGCIPGTAATDTHSRAVFGVGLPDGGSEAHFVGYSVADTDYGRAVWATIGGGRSNTEAMGPLWDIHGLSRDLLFAVGGYDPSERFNDPRVYRFRPDLNDWRSELVQNISGVTNDRLRGVWVVGPKLAYAVGESSSMFIWDGSNWSKHPAPAGEDLLSVVAFGKSSIYVSTASGKVYRYNGSTWSAMPGLTGGGALNDIAATSPENIWVVGAGGRILHWPR